MTDETTSVLYCSLDGIWQNAVWTAWSIGMGFFLCIWPLMFHFSFYPATKEPLATLPSLSSMSEVTFYHALQGKSYLSHRLMSYFPFYWLVGRVGKVIGLLSMGLFSIFLFNRLVGCVGKVIGLPPVGLRPIFLSLNGSVGSKGSVFKTVNPGTLMFRYWALLFN